MRNAEIKQNELLHMQEVLITTPTKMCMCVLQHRCAEHWVQCTTKQDMTLQVLFVSQCLGHVSNPANNEDQYICKSCDKRLKETSNENLVLPYYGKCPHAVA